jgi:hypothetical protein
MSSLVLALGVGGCSSRTEIVVGVPVPIETRSGSGEITITASADDEYRDEAVGSPELGGLLTIVENQSGTAREVVVSVSQDGSDGGVEVRTAFVPGERRLLFLPLETPALFSTDRTVPTTSLLPYDDRDITTFPRDLHAGGMGVCIRRYDGTVACAAPGASRLDTVPGLENVRAVALGGRHGCALTTIDHTLMLCWGDNRMGAFMPVSDGDYGAEEFPTATEALREDDPILGIAASDRGTCVHLDGTETTPDRVLCVHAGSDWAYVEGLPEDASAMNLRGLDCSADDCCIGIREPEGGTIDLGNPTGGVWCWSAAPDTTAEPQYTAQRAVFAMTTCATAVDRLRVGDRFLCAKGSYRGWRCSRHLSGERPDLLNSFTDCYQDSIGTDHGFDLGLTHACALTTTRQLVCTGFNGFGQTGLAPATGSGTSWTPVGLSDVRQVVAGPHFTCVMSGGPRIRCFGTGWSSETSPTGVEVSW